VIDNKHFSKFEDMGIENIQNKTEKRLKYEQSISAF
jgi:hypothetical protein